MEVQSISVVQDDIWCIPLLGKSILSAAEIIVDEIENEMEKLRKTGHR
jgi:hypothetical protein